MRDLDRKVADKPFLVVSKEEARENFERRYKKIKPLIDSLDKWREESLYAPIVIY